MESHLNAERGVRSAELAREDHLRTRNSERGARNKARQAGQITTSIKALRTRNSGGGISTGRGARARKWLIPRIVAPIRAYPRMRIKKIKMRRAEEEGRLAGKIPPYRDRRWRSQGWVVL